jgi:hypothetical protein
MAKKPKATPHDAKDATPNMNRNPPDAVQVVARNWSYFPLERLRKSESVKSPANTNPKPE